MTCSEDIVKDCWQGLLRLVILHQAGLGPFYGARFSKLLHQHGYGISPGRLYPLLHHMKETGLLRSSIKIFKGRARKYYDLTPLGQTCLASAQRHLPPLLKEAIGIPIPLLPIKPLL